MLQNAPTGAQHKRALAHFEYYRHGPGVDFDASDQGSDDVAPRRRRGRREPALDAARELLQAPDDQAQVGAQRLLLVHIAALAIQLLGALA